MTRLSVQQTYAPNNQCFGCGPANAQGLRLGSFLQEEFLVAEFQPQPHHCAFEGMLNGGIIGTLLDCHCNWRAAMALLQRDQLPAPPCTVTAEYTIKMLRPTPIVEPVQLRAWCTETGERRVTVAGELSAGGIVTATCQGVFVAVRPGHPAYHRW